VIRTERVEKEPAGPRRVRDQQELIARSIERESRVQGPARRVLVAEGDDALARIEGHSVGKMPCFALIERVFGECNVLQAHRVASAVDDLDPVSGFPRFVAKPVPVARDDFADTERRGTDGIVNRRRSPAPCGSAGDA
jgi:hypothetical protein